MNYVVVDLEWNQAMDPQSYVFNMLPIRLRGEIIEIGAVKLDENMLPTDEFQIDVKPVYFKRMHYKVKKLTGFDTERLEKGVSFPEALARFREWCGDGVTFLTWGYDDQGIMEQNIIIHDLDWDWIAGWVNLQIIYNMQTDGSKDQRSLATAMEHFGIEQTRVAHDALGDAYNTGLICSKLDLVSGIEQYKEALVKVKMNVIKSEYNGNLPEPLERKLFSAFSAMREAFDDESVNSFSCPVCGAGLKRTDWVRQGYGRYMSLAECERDGRFLIRLRFKRLDDGKFRAARLVYEADDELARYFEEKRASEGKRRKRITQRRNRNTGNAGGTSEQ